MAITYQNSNIIMIGEFDHIGGPTGGGTGGGSGGPGGGGGNSEGGGAGGYGGGGGGLGGGGGEGDPGGGGGPDGFGFTGENLGTITSLDLKVTERVTADSGEQYVKLLPVASAGGPGVQWHRSILAKLDYTGNSVSEADSEEIFEHPSDSTQDYMNYGGKVFYDSLNHNGVGGDPTGLQGEQFNQTWRESEATWYSVDEDKPVYVKVEQGYPCWIRFHAYANSYNGQHPAQAQVSIKVEYEAVETEAEDNDNTPAGNRAPGERGGGKDFAVYTPPPTPEPIEYSYVAPDIDINLDYDNSLESPSGMLFLNVADTEQSIMMTFLNKHVRLNTEDVANKYDVEFSELVPEEEES